MKWPRYVILQRQRKVLSQRLKVPPTVNQFKNTLEKNQAAELFRLLAKYAPETAAEKKARLAAKAKAEAEGKPAEEKRAPFVVKYGLDNVTKLGVSYAIVKGKARLGALVHQKTATCVCLTGVNPEDEATLNSLQESFATKYAESKKWGGGIMGLKTQRKLSIRAAAIAAEKRKN